MEVIPTDATKTLLITLLKSALTQQPQPVSGDWDPDALLKLACRHQVAPMIYDGAVRCGLDPEAPASLRLFQLYGRALQQDQRQMAGYTRLCQALTRAGLDYLPLKGCRMKALYPKPEMRTMGDADILIRTGQRSALREVMLQQGYLEAGESDHELIWKSPALTVELHKHLVPTYDTDYYAYYADGWRFAHHLTDSGFVMTPEDEFVYLFTHFAKHFRAGGAGCRYVADLWVFLRAHPELDHAYVEAELEKLRLLTFYRHMQRLLGHWFSDVPSEEILERIGEFILNHGVWGDAESQALSKTLKASAGHSKAAYIRKLLFPGLKDMQYLYPVLQKAPALLPVTWVARGFSSVFLQPERLRKKRRAVRALDQAAIARREDFLHTLGLEYRDTE